MSLVTAAKLKTIIGRPNADDAETALIALIQDAAERAVKTYLGYEVEEDSYTEYLPIAGNDLYESALIAGDDALIQYNGVNDKLFLNQLPVRSIVSLYENQTAYGVAANFTAANLLTEGTHFYLHRGGTTISKSGMVVRIGSSWPNTPMSVKVGYTAGYTANELAKTNIPYAVMLAFSAAWSEILAWQGSEIGQGAGPIGNEKIGSWSADYSQQAIDQALGMMADLPMKVKMLLQPYRKIDVVAV